MTWHRRGRRRLASTVVVVVAACAAPQIASAETVPLPSGAASGAAQDYVLDSTACPAAGDCVAVGRYADGSGNGQGLIETESNGSWTAQELNLSSLPSVLSNPSAELSSVACTSVGNCVAGGAYVDSDSHQQGLIATETGGSWTVSEVNTSALPSLYSSNPDVTVTSVSCPSAGDCTAVGYYTDGSDAKQGLILSESNGTWTAGKLSLSGLSTASNPSVNLVQVSCASAGNCAAVGTYRDSFLHSQALLVTESNGTWTAGEANLSQLPSVAGNPEAFVESVSCPSVGACTAVGYYVDGTSSYQGLLLNQSGSTWQPATEATLPADAAGSTNLQNDLYVNSVSCASAGNCTAVGAYDSTSANDVEGLELTETNGSWAPGVEANLPGAGSSNPEVWLASVACVSAEHCVTAGSYDGSDGNNQALIAQQSGGNWTTAGVEQPTTYDNYTDDGAGVACAPGGYCAAAGYTLSDVIPNNDSGFLFDAPGAVTSPSATVDGTSAQVAWTAPSDTGGLPITGYTITANDLTDSARGGQTITVGTSGGPTFKGLTPDDTYTFAVSATSLMGTGIAATTESVAVPASKQQISASLGKLLAPKGAASRLRSLRRTHAYTFTYKPLESGRVTVRWYHITGHGKHKKKRLVASGSARTTGTSSVKVHVKLNKLGRRLVKSSHKLRLTARVTFSSGSTTVTLTHTFTLR